MKRIISDTAGMSLMEVTFAMGILATTLSLLFGSLINITVVSRLNEERAIANTELASILEDMRGRPLADVLEYAPEIPGHPGVEQTVLMECYNGDGGAVSLPMALSRDEQGALTGPLPDLPNPLEVKVTLLWTTDSGHVFKAEATTSLGR